MNHIGEPFLEINPRDAAARGLTTADLCEVSSPTGTALLRVLITPRQLPGRVFAPMHWTDQYASRGRVGPVIAAHVDPHSGQPELKRMPVQVKRFAAQFHGFAVSVSKPASQAAEYWALAPARNGWRLEFSGTATPADWVATARALLAANNAELLAYHDTARGTHRFAAFAGEKFLGALFVGPEPVAVARGWLASLLSAPPMDGHARLAVLAGRSGDASADQGPIVCACFEVGHHRIAAAIASGHASVDAVGAATNAGTNCGSCRAEIGGLIDAIRLAYAV